jgi:acyl-CoA thioester hydrolase
MRKSYFRTHAGDPPPLRRTVERVVRFEEVDALGIVWHGRYPSYFEDGRVLLGERFGIGYLDFYRAGILAPIKQLQIDYQKPLRFGDPFTIEATLYWSEAARLNHAFILRNAAGEVTTSGSSVQLLLDKEERLLLLAPPFFENFRQRWLAGELT